MLTWLSRWRKGRKARRLIAEAFRTPDLLKGTSLRSRHASRWILVDYETDGDSISRIRFGILRHPRPYAFSRQSHKVIEYYIYDVLERRIARLEGHNITRAGGRDSD